MKQIDLRLKNLELNERETKIVNLCLVTQGKNKGFLRSGKPAVSADPDTGIAAYLWRMLAFALSTERQHQCMPVCADFDLPGKFRSEEYQEAKNFGDALEKKIIANIPVTEQAGTMRWAGAFGLIR